MDDRRQRRQEEAQAGDARLEDLLRRGGSPLGAAEARELAAAIAAAPPGFGTDGWPELFGGTPDAELERALGALVAAARRSQAQGMRPDPARLDALRAELDRLGVDGFIVPRADRHQGEYIPARAERLAWLTGFTGSAGLAVFLKDKAAIFVDGRYTLQVRQQVDTGRYAVRHLTDEPAPDWIAENLARGGRLGFDPWLHTPNDVERLRVACARADGELVALAANPVDAVWPDQPPPPVSPIVAHDLAFAGLESAAKRAEIARTLSGEGADAALIVAPDSIAWLLNVRGGDVPFTPFPLSFALVHADGTLDWFVDRRKLLGETVQHLGEGVRIRAEAELGPAIDRLGSARQRLCLDTAGAPEWAAERARRAGATVVPGPDPCALPKACKNPVEIEGTRAAHRRDGVTVTRFLAWLAREAPSGRLTEIDAAERLYALRRENQRFRGPSFSTISGAGPNGAIVHYRVSAATNRRIEPGMLYLVDSGGQYLDGTTDVTRTVAVGVPSAEMRDRFTRVLKGHIAIATARFPRGTTGSQLDALARRALWDAGLDYDHGTGHGVGSYLGVHEGPHRISKLPNAVALREGMIVSNEPGYYKTGAFGIRIENLVTVVRLPAVPGEERETLGFETLTLAPIDRALIEPAGLAPDEIAWLDAYHRRVCETLAPLVDAETRAWLAEATRPLP